MNMQALHAVLLGAMLLAFPAECALARPELDRPAGPTVADTGSAAYRFENLNFVSADGERRYRVVVAIPRRPAAATGYPAVYLLDGNAALAALDEPLLQTLAGDDPPVIVALGYETPLRFDVRSRAFDYTPPLADGQSYVDELAGDRKGGGAGHFLDLLEQRIKPAVEKLAPVDRARQTLWGHSYGGLFVLHVLATRPEAFQSYASADPSLWWRRGEMIERLRAVAGNWSRSGFRLLVMRSGEDRDGAGPAGASPEAMAARRQAVASVPEDAARQLARELSGWPGLSVHYREFPTLTHGGLLPVSLKPALRLSMGHLDD